MNASIAPDAAFCAAPRISAIAVSEILRITSHANALKSQGHDVVVLGAGEPDFDTPEAIKSAAISAIERGDTKYTVLDGSREMKRAIQQKFATQNNLEFALDEITVGAGAKQIIFNAFMATLRSLKVRSWMVWTRLRRSSSGHLWQVWQARFRFSSGLRT